MLAIRVHSHTLGLLFHYLISFTNLFFYTKNSLEYRFFISWYFFSFLALYVTCHVLYIFMVYVPKQFLIFLYLFILSFAMLHWILFSFTILFTTIRITLTSMRLMFYIVGFNAWFLRKHEKGKNCDIKHVSKITEPKLFFFMYIFYFRSSDNTHIHTHCL